MKNRIFENFAGQRGRRAVQQDEREPGKRDEDGQIERKHDVIERSCMSHDRCFSPVEEEEEEKNERI